MQQQVPWIGSKFNLPTLNPPSVAVPRRFTNSLWAYCWTLMTCVNFFTKCVYLLVCGVGWWVKFWCFTSRKIKSNEHLPLCPAWGQCRRGKPPDFVLFLSPMRIPNLVSFCCLLMHICILIEIRPQCVYQVYALSYTHWVSNCNSQAKCIYAWANNKRIWHNEYMH